MRFKPLFFCLSDDLHSQRRKGSRSVSFYENPLDYFNDINPHHSLIILIKAKTIMRLNIQLIYTATVLLIGSVSGFISPLKQNRILKSHHSTKHQILKVRGGDTSTSTALQMHLGPILLKEALVSGNSLKGVGALYAISSLTVVPLTWYRTGYSFSVGYGFSVAMAAASMLASFGYADGIKNLDLTSLSIPSILAMTALLYGIRLGLYIFVRKVRDSIVLSCVTVCSI